MIRLYEMVCSAKESIFPATIKSGLLNDWISWVFIISKVAGLALIQKTSSFLKGPKTYHGVRQLSRLLVLPAGRTCNRKMTPILKRCLIQTQQLAQYSARAGRFTLPKCYAQRWKKIYASLKRVVPIWLVRDGALFMMVSIFLTGLKPTNPMP